MNKWTVVVEEDQDDLVIPLPSDMLESLGWLPGDTLVWDVLPDQTIVLRKKEKWYQVIVRWFK